MKIVLDFDDTILNTGELLKKVTKIFEDIGFTKDEFIATYDKSKEMVGEFNLEPIIGLLSKQRPFDKNKVRKEFNLIIDEVGTLVYPDFFDFAKSFDKKDLILLSIARTDFQEAKIEKTGIVPFFSEVIVTPVDKFEEISLMVKKYPKEKFFLVDDKADQIDKVKTKLPEVVTMKMERPQGRHNEKKSKLTDYTVRDFIEVKKIINPSPFLKGIGGL